MPLTVGKERIAAVGERRLQADRGQRILQCASRAHVHVNVTRGDERQAAGTRQIDQARESRRVAGSCDQLRSHPSAFAEYVGDPARLRARERVVVTHSQVQRRKPHCEATRAERRDVVARQCIAAFNGVTSPARDQLCKVAIALAIGRVERQL